MRLKLNLTAMTGLNSGPIVAHADTLGRRSIKQKEQRDMALPIATIMVAEPIDAGSLRSRRERFMPTDGSENFFTNHPLICPVRSC